MANLAGWPYWKVISITGQAGSGTDYQVELEIGDSAGGGFHLEGHCTNFPQDIRITDDDGTTLLDHFVEDLTADPIKVWVEVKDDLGSNRDIRVYCGKSGETTVSSISNTFLKGDDIEDGDISDLTTTGGTWTAAADQKYQGSYSIKGVGGSTHRYAYYDNIISDDVVIEGWVRTLDDYVGFVWGWQNSSNYYYTQLKPSTNIIYIVHHISGSDTGHETTVSVSHDTWYFIRVIWESDGTHTVYIYDTGMNLLGSKSMSENSFSSGKFGYHNYKTGWVDNFKVRKYNSPEPAFSSAGAEQTPGLVSVFIRHNPALTGGMV